MEQDTEFTPVLFRVSRAPVRNGSEVTAIFPCEPADYIGNQMTCYVYVGQHGSCDFGWYRTTRPAKPEEYTSLFAELESIGYRLKVYKRINSKLRNTFRKNLREINQTA